jgi:hypothetical protein
MKINGTRRVHDGRQRSRSSSAPDVLAATKSRDSCADAHRTASEPMRRGPFPGLATRPARGDLLGYSDPNHLMHRRIQPERAEAARRAHLAAVVDALRDVAGQLQS